MAGITTSNVTISSGGTENISSGGVASGVADSGTNVSAGTVNVLSGGTAAFVKVFTHGTLNLSSGATAHPRS